MGHFIYVLTGILFGIIVGFLVGVVATNKSRDKDRWDEIRSGQFVYDARVYYVHLRKEETD